MCILILDERFAKESKTVTDSVNKTSHAKTPNGSGPKDLTPMPETPNGGWPDLPNERQSNERLSIEDNPKDDPREDNPAFLVNSKGQTPVSSSFGTVSENGQKQLTESEEEEESPEEQIERLAAKFAEFSAADARGMGAAYKAECETNDGQWKNNGMRNPQKETACLPAP